VAIASPAIVAARKNRISASTTGNFHAGRLATPKPLVKPVASGLVGKIDTNVPLAWLAMILVVLNRGPVRSRVSTWFLIRQVKR